jgi:hypothetical protein
MKKVLIAICFFILLSFNEEKKYKVELSIEQWNIVLQTIEESNAAHSEVKAVQNWIIPQLQQQLDSTKKK